MTNSPSMLHWVKTHKLISLLIGMGSLIVILSALQSLIPSSASWNSITPGKTSLEELKKKLGTPFSEKDHGDTTFLEYASDFPVYPNEVMVQKNTVSFIKEWVPASANKSLGDYIKIYGEPEFTTIVKETYESHTLHVFASKGVAVNAHNQTKQVFHVWYFPPTTQEKFLSIFSEQLETQQGGREQFQ